MGELRLKKGALRKMVYQNKKLAAHVQEVANHSKSEGSIRVGRYDGSDRWRVGIRDWAGNEFKHGTITRTVANIKI